MPRQLADGLAPRRRTLKRQSKSMVADPFRLAYLSRTVRIALCGDTPRVLRLCRGTGYPLPSPCRDSLDRWLPGISGRGSNIRQLARSSAAGSHSHSSIVGAVESGSWSVPAATGSSCSSARTPVAGPRLTNLLSCRGRLTVATAAGTFRTLDETSRLSPQRPRAVGFRFERRPTESGSVSAGADGGLVPGPS